MVISINTHILVYIADSPGAATAMKCNTILMGLVAISLMIMMM